MRDGAGNATGSCASFTTSPNKKRRRINFGKVVVEEKRKLDRDVLVFVARGYGEEPAMKNPPEIGFTASIRKPFRKAELSEMLNRCL